jgi:DNA-binding HxlR family transcriptional regulator
MQLILLVDCKFVLWQPYSVQKLKQNKPVKSLSVRRSLCPVACSLDVLGDRWTLLVIRDLFLGGSRFKDFAASPEGIPTNILSERLERLLQHGIVERIPARDGTKRLAYRLTTKGKALRPVLVAMRDWGLAWDKSTRAMLPA